MKVLVENLFHEFVGEGGTCARIRGGEDLQMAETCCIPTLHEWEKLTAIVLPLQGEVLFRYAMRGARRSYTDEYVATPSGVFKISSGAVEYHL